MDVKDQYLTKRIGAILLQSLKKFMTKCRVFI